MEKLSRVLVCGGRDYADRERVFSVLDRLHADRPLSALIEGGARGADALGREWAKARSVPVQTYAADWSKGRSAGPIRNRQMLDEGRPDLVVAFAGGAGTANMIAQAERAGVEVLSS